LDHIQDFVLPVYTHVRQDWYPVSVFTLIYSQNYSVVDRFIVQHGWPTGFEYLY